MPSKPLTKLLIVDDDLDILEIIRFSLADMRGVTIRYCRSGQEAIQEAMAFHPDFMLIDVMMPNMDGIALLKVLRLMPEFMKTPIAFLTAKVQKEDLAQYNTMGVKDVIVKPFDPISLPETILKMWERS